VADQEHPPVGSVAEEAARLLDALGGWASTHGYAAGSPEPATTPGAGGAHGCPTCGAQEGVGKAVVCQLCPVCQGIGLLRSVRPETVDRIADLAGALAATLRDLADQRRAGGAAPDDGPGPGAGRVQDIPVDDEDAAP
jgi:hypothetical protein